jgi:hypothetical protein
MGRLVVPRSILVLVLTLLSAACADSTSVTTAGGLEPEPITTVSATTTTDSALETTTSKPREETTTSPSPATSFTGIAGTYGAKDPADEGFLQIMDDGILHWAPNENSPQIVLNARFEGPRVLISDPDCGEDVEGVYEFHLLETGGLTVVLVEDACPGRASSIPGEYTPVE